MGPIHDWPWHRCDPARDSERRCAVFRVGICRQLWSRGAACDWWRKWVYWHVGIPRVSGQCRYLDGAARPWALSLDTCDPGNTLHDHSNREHYRRAVKLITHPALVALRIGEYLLGSHCQRQNALQRIERRPRPSNTRSFADRVFLNARRHAYATRFCHPFEPACDVHSIPKDVTVLDYYVPSVNADAELDAPVRGALSR